MTKGDRDMAEKQIDPRCKTCGFPHSNIAHVIDHLFVYDDETARCAR